METLVPKLYNWNKKNSSWEFPLEFLWFYLLLPIHKEYWEFFPVSQNYFHNKRRRWQAIIAASYIIHGLTWFAVFAYCIGLHITLRDSNSGFIEPLYFFDTSDDWSKNFRQKMRPRLTCSSHSHGTWRCWNYKRVATIEILLDELTPCHSVPHQP